MYVCNVHRNLNIPTIQEEIKKFTIKYVAQSIGKESASIRQPSEVKTKWHIDPRSTAALTLIANVVLL